MLKKFSLYLFLIVHLMFMVACSGSESASEKDNEVIYSGDTGKDTSGKESLIDRNKKLILLEQEKIDAYKVKHQLTMEKTKTGIHYKIDFVGKGEKPHTLDEVTLKYKIELLDGTYCYSSDSSGVLQIKIGQSDEPTGLQEVLQLIPRGSIAKVIIPSYLAYGLSGDGNKIGSGASLVYDIAIINQNK
mgnify:FL=1